MTSAHPKDVEQGYCGNCHDWTASDDDREGWRILEAHEAAATIALSHPTKCPCIVCRAAHGDPEAMAEVLEALEL